MSMTTVVLGGYLGREFGRRVWRFDLDTGTPREAVRALCSAAPGLKARLADPDARGFHVFARKRDLGEDDLDSPAGDIIAVVPALVGAGGDDGPLDFVNNPVFRVVAGAVLIAAGIAAIFIPGFQGFAQPLIGLGASLVLGGVSELLFKPPEPTAPQELGRNPSYSFNGPVNTMAQGHPVPVLYGRMEVGSQVVSAGLVAEMANAGAFGGTGGTDNKGPDGSPPGGGGCPAPHARVLLDGGREEEAGRLRPGLRVWTRHEATGSWGAYEVEGAELIESSERVRADFGDGRVLVCSPEHRMWATTPGAAGPAWVHVRDMAAGTVVHGLRTAYVREVSKLRPGPVVRVTVREARTYVVLGLLNHNVKRSAP